MSAAACAKVRLCGLKVRGSGADVLDLLERLEGERDARLGEKEAELVAIGGELDAAIAAAGKAEKRLLGLFPGAKRTA